MSSSAYRLGFLTLIALVFSSWFASLEKPMLGSHADRQMETAVSAKVFVQEGWNPLLPKMRFSARPGYCILECPIYQSVVACIAYISGASIDTSGRLLSLLSAIFLILALLSLLKQIHPLSKEALPLLAALALSAPELFGVTQWVTIEIFNAALAAWALWVFIRIMKDSDNVSLGSFVGLIALMLCSILVKPIGLFGIGPLFVYGLWQCIPARPATSSVFRKKIIYTVTACLLTLLTLVLWNAYADRIDVRYQATYRISGAMGHLMLDPQFFKPRNFAKIYGRVLLYIIGPGTWLWIVFSVAWHRGEVIARIQTQKHVLLACGLCVVLYLTVFVGANSMHNYYQLAVFLPIFLALFVSVPFEVSTRSIVLILLSCAANAYWGQKRLATNDRDWLQALPYIREHILDGTNRPDVLITSNTPVTAGVATYYIDRYGQIDVHSRLKTLDKSIGDWIIVCDNNVETTCVEKYQSTSCDTQRTIGHLWICMGKNPIGQGVVE